MASVLALVLPLFSLILIGYIAGKVAKLPIEGLAWMNFFIVYIALPAMFFQLLAKTPIEQFSNLGFIALTTGTTFIVFLIAFSIAYLRNKGDIAQSTIQGYAGAYGNIGYMGPPLALLAFGPEAGIPVALVFCFDNTLHFVLAPTLMGAARRDKTSIWRLVKNILINIFTHPFIIATILGVLAAFSAFKAPLILERILEFLQVTAGPCALFVMGVTSALRPLKKVPTELLYLVPLKLLVQPILLYFVLTTFVPDLNSIWLYSAVLLAGLPAATNVFVLAQQYSVWQERASSAIIISTLLAVFTLTMYLYMIEIKWI
ncbi:MAG: AEC family transporter [Nitratireductor sp.]